MRDLITLCRPLLTCALRGLLVLCVTLGLVWPKASAAVISFLPGVQSYVICTGDALVTIVVDASGTPVEQAEVDTPPCLSADLAKAHATAPTFWHKLARDYAMRFVVLETARHPLDVFQRRAPSRAPPVLV